LLRIFGGVDSPVLEQVSLKPPLRGGRANIRFKKGVSEIPYDLLSSGEKEVITILLNLFDKYNFDEKHVLLPESKTSLDIFDVAVPRSSIF